MSYKPYIDNDELQKSFGFCMDIDKTFHIHLCLYTINEFQITTSKEKEVIHSTVPYIKYIVEKKDASIAFPSFEYICPIMNEIHSASPVPPIETQMGGEHQDGDNTDEKNHFETELFKQWLNVYMDTTELHNLNVQFNEIYKGYIEMGENNSDLYVFIDVENINLPFKENILYATMDELLFKKAVLSLPVEENITRLLKSHPELIYMKTETDAEIPIPFQLYMCKVENGLYTTIQTSDNQYIYPLEHSIFGPGYICTAETLGEKDTLRFICHIDKCLYMLETIQDIETNKMVQIKETSSISTSIYFHEDELQLWLLRNINAIHKL